MVTHFKLFEIAANSRIVALKKPLNGVKMKNPLNGLDRSRACSFIYNQTEAVLKGRHADESWLPISIFFKKLDEIGIEWESIDNRYYNFPPKKDDRDGPRKEWTLKILFINDRGNITELHGTITASSRDERFDAYDCWLTIN